MKEDEKLLLEAMLKRGNKMDPTAWEVAESLGIAYKRARYILRDKWTRKRWYDYGTSWRVGWLRVDKIPEDMAGDGNTN